jgi:hypothetical protein
VACSRSEPLPGDPRTCVDRNLLRNPYFGDLHIHTKYSLDASTQGTAVGPHDAYRFALGERIPVQPYDDDGVGLRSTQLIRPLDFAAVTDHSEFFGETEICTHPEYPGYNSPECQFYRDQPDQAFIVFNAQLAESGQPTADGGKKVPRFAYCGPEGQDCLNAARTPWGDIQRAAEAFYDRSDECRFTTLLGYEWTGSPRSNNWHRNVLFRSDTVPALPISYMDAAAPEYLWRGLAQQCRAEDGCNSLTIPHNSNLSGGIMFQTTDDNGLPFTTEFAQEKQDNEPLAEVMQHKGQSECLNRGASAADELCGYEILPYNNLAGDRFGGGNPPLEQDFLRSALKEGLAQEQMLGVNPFKYGLIASTDTHIGAAGQVLEDRFPGHGGAGQPNRDELPPGLTDLIEYNPGGLAVLWAEQNTRESLYDAMRRREAYGTSGPRMVVRFFGGWNLPSDMCESGNFVSHGYGLGVPMGGDLPAAGAADRKPRFAVSALRDPGATGEPGLPLQRIQIVKGWLENGEKQEAVFEIAGDPHNGATANPQTCETSGDGFASLCGTWVDPAFDRAQPAFYYARVVQNPSCRWSAYQCARGGITAASCPLPSDHPYAACCDATYPKIVQERAWTSPIWYRP